MREKRREGERDTEGDRGGGKRQEEVMNVSNRGIFTGGV